jgi:hypothetical protein
VSRVNPFEDDEYLKTQLGAWVLVLERAVADLQRTLTEVRQFDSAAGKGGDDEQPERPAGTAQSGTDERGS